MKLKIWIVLFTMFGLTGCEKPQTQDTVQREADVIFTDGHFWLGDDDQSVEAMAVSNGEILALGKREDILKLGNGQTQLISLDGGFVYPGFIDNHTHFLNGGLGLSSVQLRDANTSEAFSQRIGDFAKTQPAGRWIRQGDWDHELWGGNLPHKNWIDSVTPEHPVFVSRLDGHMALANSVALELAGISAETLDPPGGEIVRDHNGEPTGVLKDTAMFLVDAVIPPLSSDELDDALDAAIEHALANGVTQIHDMGGGAAPWAMLEMYQRAQLQDRLDIRVYAFLPLEHWADLAEYVQQHGRGDDHLRWGGLKGFVDGSLGSTTAWFYAPYDDAPESTGLVLQDNNELADMIRQADAAGLHVTVHAIGDRANEWLLNTFEKTIQQNGAFQSDLPDRRFRIEHAQHLNQASLNRFNELNVIASMQPYHAIDDGRWAEKRIGRERIKLTYAFRSLLDNKAPLTFGSDWTVAPISPLDGLYAAITRRTIDGANPDGWVPEQKIHLKEAIHAYTQSNAYAGYQENRLGELTVGKLADFVVLNEDLFGVDPERIPSIQVLHTVVNGKVRYSAN